MKVAIIDYGRANLFSVQRACEQVGLSCLITSDKSELLSSDAAILPGVGAFGDAITSLKKLDLISPIKDFIKSGKFFMGICLGMQLLMDESEEFGKHDGLKIIPGRVVRFFSKGGCDRLKVPQVGWNQIYTPLSETKKFWDNTPLDSFPNGEFMYFVHSYYCEPENDSDILTLTKYGPTKYCSGILLKNIFAVQFHPEKSAKSGLAVYQNWAALIKKSRGGS